MRILTGIKNLCDLINGFHHGKFVVIGIARGSWGITSCLQYETIWDLSIRRKIPSIVLTTGPDFIFVKNLLTLKRNRLNKLIKLVDKTLKGDDSMSFSEFDVSEIEKLQKEYADEAKEMYGNTDKYKMFQEKTKNYSKSDWDNLYEKIEVIFKKFASVMDKGETSEEVQDLVKEWKNFISENLYDCNNETLLGLSRLYIDDKRFTKNIDKHKNGLADFISKSIQIYCK